ncbi:MAG: flagellar export protein FliJ [Burkholderiaceae bacterium]
MSSPSSLPLLIELATGQRDQAATRYARALQQAGQIDRQLGTLRHYAGDYVRKGHQQRISGIDAAAHANQSAFVGRIDQVVEQQVAELERVRALAEAERQQMLALERKLKSLETLATRQAELLRAATGRREQKQMDEMAAQVLRRREEP